MQNLLQTQGGFNIASFQSSKGILFIPFVLMGLNFFMQNIIFLPFLDNQAVNAYQPAGMDAYGYVELAKNWVTSGSFSATFQDSIRLPGYPAFLSLFYMLFEESLKMARYGQMFLLSSCILIAAAISRELNVSKQTELFCVGVVSIWPAFYYFAPILYAEGLSIFLFFCLFYFLIRLGKFKLWKYICIISFILAYLVYTKPNHIFLFIPVAMYLLEAWGWYPQCFKKIVTIGLLIAMLLLPWTVFISLKHSQFIPLSLTNAINFLEATGDYGQAMPDSLPGKYSKANGFFEDCPNWNCIDTQKLFDPKEATNLRAKAVSIWVKRPIKTMVYGFMKIAHSHGFSFRNIVDFVFSILLLFSFLSISYLYKKNIQRPFVFFFFGCLIVSSFQSFMFLPDQRFKIVVFDLPALFVVSIAFMHRYSRKKISIS